MEIIPGTEASFVKNGDRGEVYKHHPPFAIVSTRFNIITAYRRGREAAKMGETRIPLKVRRVTRPALAYSSSDQAAGQRGRSECRQATYQMQTARLRSRYLHLL